MLAENKVQLSIDEIETALRPLVKNFHEHPLENGRKMRELLNLDRDAFPLAAVRIFSDSEDERGCRYLVTILWIQDLLTSLFVNVRIPQQLCFAMAQTAAKVDPQFHLRLSGFLQRGMLENEDMPGEVATKILEILSATMEPVAISPLLRKILLHPNARVRSKATLLIGRGQTGIGVVERLLPDEDPRVRANALEALWGNPDPRAVSIFLAALGDSNNRAVGNAIVGLHLAGSVESIAAALELAKHPDPVSRGTAAWVMGKSADPRFRVHLGRLLGESTGQLRKIVFQALQTSKKAALAQNADTLELRSLGCQMDESRVFLHITVAEASTTQLLALPPTAFIISVGAESAVDYSCKAEGKRSSVAFLLPEQGKLVPPAALQDLLAKKPDQEQWKVIQYCPQKSDAIESSPARESYSCDRTVLLAQLTAESNPTASADLSGSLRGLIENSPPAATVRHLIMVLDAPLALDSDTELHLIEQGRAANYSLHALSLQRDPKAERLCKGRSGSCHAVSSSDLMVGELEVLYASLNCRYAIDFPAALLEKSPSEPIVIQAYTSTGLGRLEIARPGDNEKPKGPKMWKTG